MGLFKPAWMTDKQGKKNKAVVAVQKVTDQAQLAKIAREAPLGEVRAKAVSRMTDQVALYDIATTDGYFVIRQTAIRRMDEAHLVRFAGKVPTQEYIRTCRPGNPEEDEVLAASLITSSEALADLYLLLKENRYGRMHAKDVYPHWSGYGPKGKCEAAVEERMGEAESAIAARKVLAGGGTVDPTGFLGTRILSPELRRELGIDLNKAELTAMFKEKPSGDVAKVLWPMLDCDEKRDLQREATQYLCDGRMLSSKLFAELIDYIDGQANYKEMLMTNPNHERNLMTLIERVSDPAALREFLAMLDERDVYTKPAITPPPKPADNNFIIHTRDHHDFRAVGRVRQAAERRLRELDG